MLVLKRKGGQWVEVTHRSGDLLRIWVGQIAPGQVNLAFDDDLRNFEIERPERRRQPLPTTTEGIENLGIGSAVVSARAV